MNTLKKPHDSPRQGNTVPHVDQTRAPRLPHEHDESADSQAIEAPRPEIQQAHDDLKRGLVDTDRSPQMGATYKRLATDKTKRKKP